MSDTTYYILFNFSNQNTEIDWFMTTYINPYHHHPYEILLSQIG